MTVQATFCATLSDEWARAGVRHAVIAPGSRSTPLALALASDGRIAVHVFHDERPASFCALGIGMATGVPAVVLCSSGTAATHFHAAVVEAHQARVPLLVCTADRPPELRDVGAPQTIDQSHLYGSAVRWFCDPGVADDAVRSTWRSLAARAFGAAADGPVHLNLPFREPLAADSDPLPAGRPDGRPWHRWGTVEATPADVAEWLSGRRGVIVAGGSSVDRRVVDEWAGALQWPVLADPRAGASDPPLWDGLLRVPSFVDGHRPEVTLRIGAMPASKVLAQWLVATDADHVVVDPGRSDPDRLAHLIVPALGRPTAVEPAAPAWLDSWRTAGAAAESAVASVLAEHGEVTEPFVARSVVESLDVGADLVVASSMPIRDVEWFGRISAGANVYANRGANGIDGTIASAIGVALARPDTPTTVLLGDIAFLHDSSALVAIRRRNIDLTIVVVDNDGGGIFSFLPQASSLANERFEQLFGTPHGVRPEEVAAAHGLASLTIEDPSALAPALASTRDGGGVWLVVARTDRDANVKIHDELGRAISAAMRING